MNNEGYTKLYRKFLEWEWFDKPEMISVFIYCLIKANHVKKKWRGITIERGQFITSISNINKKTKLSVQTIRTCLKRLKSTGEITNYSTNRFRVITICNYESYQSLNLQTNKQTNRQTNIQLTCKQQATNKLLTTTKNEENEENEENIKNIQKYFPKELNNPEFIEKFKQWLEYKKENKFTYKPTGLRNLISYFKNEVIERSIEDVIFAITDSMAQGYKGVTFRNNNNFNNNKSNDPDGLDPGETI